MRQKLIELRKKLINILPVRDREHYPQLSEKTDVARKLVNTPETELYHEQA